MTTDQWLQLADNSALNGWHPIPTGRVQSGDDAPKYKIPWLPGITGKDAGFPTGDQYPVWLDRVREMKAQGAKGILSLGLRCGPDRIGIDVDNYGSKSGLASLQELEKRFGPLPPAPAVTARGLDSGSGIRLFKIRKGWMGNPNPAAGIELVQWWHRHIQAPPSWHYTGQTVKCYRADRRLIRNGLVPAELPMLPDSWADGLLYVPSQGGDSESYTDAEFSNRYADGPQPDVLDGLIRSKLGEDSDDTHTPMLILLSKAAQEARGKRYGWAGVSVVT